MQQPQTKLNRIVPFLRGMSSLTLSLVLCIMMSGCKRDEIRVYQAPKEPAHDALASVEMEPGAIPHLHWELPAGWEEQAKGGMRAGSFLIPGSDGKKAEVALIPLPGVKAIELESVNMWRQELGLPEIQREHLNQLGESITIGEVEGKLFDMVSSEARLDNKYKVRTVGVIMVKDGITWFFKMSGEESLVGEQKEAFKKFLAKLEFHEADHDTELTSARPVSTNTGELPPDAEEKPDWQVPAGWEERPPTMMVLAKFGVAASGGGTAEISVSKLAGEGGGLLANVNRWRNQISLPPVSEADLPGMIQTLDPPGSKAILVDMIGVDPRTGQKTRVLAAIVPHSTQTWFYKMNGEEKLVGEQKAAFIKFVQSARYPNA
ncbi:MAG: hypothetical protein AB1813_08920 [Verrucomicrobiota bacterium]